MSFECSMKTLESLKFLQPVLSCLLIKRLYFASYGSLAYQKIIKITSNY